MWKAPADGRAEPFGRLVRLLAVHETAEEEVVHPYARRQLGDGKEIVDERLREERQAKGLLQQMEAAGTADPDFVANFTGLHNAVLAHARAEERYEFAPSPPRRATLNGARWRPRCGPRKRWRPHTPTPVSRPPQTTCWPALWRR